MRRILVLRLRIVIMLALLPIGLPLVAGESKIEGGDKQTCQFHLPGKFKEALASAKKNNRCLLIKGVAFGLDEKGATCATKGHW